MSLMDRIDKFVGRTATILLAFSLFTGATSTWYGNVNIPSGNTLTLAGQTASQCLQTNGSKQVVSSGAPCNSLSLPVSIANGGTGATTLGGAPFVVLNPSGGQQSGIVNVGGPLGIGNRAGNCAFPAGTLCLGSTSTAGSIYAGGSSSYGQLDYGGTTPGQWTLHGGPAGAGDGLLTLPGSTSQVQASFGNFLTSLSSRSGIVPPMFVHGGTGVTGGFHGVCDIGQASAGSLAVTLSGTAAFTNSSSYMVSGLDISGSSVVTGIVISSGTAFTLTSPAGATDFIQYCAFGF